MPLRTFEQVKPYSSAIVKQTRRRNMPPWFADPQYGTFANDPSLSTAEIATLQQWLHDGAPEGRRVDAPPPVQWSDNWNIDKPGLVLQVSKPIRLPAHGDVPYTYVILPTHFKTDRWVRMSEIRPSNRAVVHHAVAYIRPKGSAWLRGAPVGHSFTANDLTDPALRRDAMWTTSDILLVYAPGSSPDAWPSGFAKLVPAGADIVLQIHYTTTGHADADQTSVGLVFDRDPPQKRVLTLQLTNDKFVIPPGDPNYRAEVHGTLPNAAILLSFFPHMHLRGKTFEYNVALPGQPKQTLLRVPHYDFHWQLSYRMAKPLLLPARTFIQAVATFDNSANNLHNPDPDATVSWGEQTWAEMMVGFFDIAVDPQVSKEEYFVRDRR